MSDQPNCETQNEEWRTRVAVIAQMERVSKARGTQGVFQNFDLTIRAGEVTALLGRNGAGKSTLVGLLTGRLTPDFGHVRIFGLDPARPAARARLGVMLQSTPMPDGLKVEEMVTLQCGYVQGGRSVEEALDIAGLSALRHRRASRLSGGEQRRLAYALAICTRPLFLALDEPTAALDPDSRRLMWRRIRTEVAGGAAVLLTTHDLTEAETLADRVIVIDRGRILADASPDALRAAVGGGLIRCRTVLNEPVLARLRGVRDVSFQGAEARLVSANPASTLMDLLARDEDVTDLAVDRISLEAALDILGNRRPSPNRLARVEHRVAAPRAGQ